ncbi:hypothetical protein DL240_12035 [Lujinxingia litoralis]|uniref:non-specific serine/threonine protein kinase n=1 Tax=Lujinxingia litoralis TaxID=2211119 RepID=A0A328C9E1_9DELT|nr:serine/threonine-protein kinase [Lujinxingia litoralis]RAL21580.1 hypothetical protein DL240_12035 [Lujinxingia litoralis]
MEKICPTCQRTYAPDVVYCPHDGMKLRQDRPAGDDPMIGRVLDGRWIIEKRIGTGGMGAVYLGHQRSVDRQVAIKTLRANLSDTDAFVDRFFREARIATTINHPHSVTILDFGQDEDGTLYLAMEYLVGIALSERIDQRNMTYEEVLRVGVQIASALSAAHDANIVHRDLKPDNIFLLDIPGGGTFVKVLDFGIAKVLDSETQVTRTGQVFGTPQYMSPEQCQGHQVDGRADLYSLGCIMYELVGGRPPFSAETPMAILMAHVVNEVPPLHQLSDVPGRVEQAISSLLAKDPDKRPTNAAAARANFETLLAELDPTTLASIPGSPDASSEGLLTEEHVATATDTHPPLNLAWSDSVEDFDALDLPTRSRTPLYLGAALLALLSVLALVFLRPEDTSAPADPAPTPEAATREASASAPSSAEMEARVRELEATARERAADDARALARPVQERAQAMAHTLEVAARAPARPQTRPRKTTSKRPRPAPEPTPSPAPEVDDDPFKGFFSE